MKEGKDLEEEEVKREEIETKKRKRKMRRGKEKVVSSGYLTPYGTLPFIMLLNLVGPYSYDLHDHLFHRVISSFLIFLILLLARPFLH